MTEPLANKLIYATTRIECKVQGGLSVGTGFFFSFFHDEPKYVPVIVTNRHVIQGAINIAFRMTLANSDGIPCEDQHEVTVIDPNLHPCLPHPDDAVDLVIIPIANILNNAERRRFFLPLTKNLIPSPDQLKNLTAIEEITMIGYPNGIWDKTNNIPLVRRGITATPAYVNYEGRQEFLIDAACYGGSSGSPVFIFNEGSYSMPSGIAIGTRLYLLGILWGGPVYDVQGNLTPEPIPTATGNRVLSRHPLNLGYCIKSSKLLDFEPILRDFLLQSRTT